MPKWVLQQSARWNPREENFSWTRRTSCLQSRNHLFLGWGCQNESNSHQLARIGEKKIFHELDVYDVYKVGISCFWAQDSKMSLTAISSLEWAKRKFSWTRRTLCLQRRNHLFLGHEAKMSLTTIRSLVSARRKFSWTRRTSCLQCRNQLFLGSGCQNESNSHQLAGIGEKKIFRNSTYMMSTK